MGEDREYRADEATCVDESVYHDLLTRLSSVRYRRLMYGEWLPNECEDCHTTTEVITYADTTGKEKKPIYLCRTCFEARPKRKHLQMWGFEKDTAAWMGLNEQQQHDTPVEMVYGGGNAWGKKAAHT